MVNERLNRKKGTIISTNLPVNEMRDEFTDRVMSRIVSQYQIIPLYGEDIRIRKSWKTGNGLTYKGHNDIKRDVRMR